MPYVTHLARPVRPFIAATACCLLLWLTGCQTNTPEKVLFTHLITGTDTLHYDSIAMDKPTGFRFTNGSADKAVTFWFYQQAGINYHHAGTMLASVLTPNMTNEEKALAIWKLVAGSGHHYEYDYNHQLPDHVDPISLVTFPHFMCGEKAGIVINLAILAGLPARNISLKGHEVAEVKYNDTWHMIDADENCIFRNKAGEIASVEELYRSPDLISKEQVTLIAESDFSGYAKYKKYVAGYQANWINTSSVINNYTFPTNALTLYPLDEVSFRLLPNSFGTRLKNPRYLYSTQGILKRRIILNHKNVQTANNTIVYTENTPYFITALHVYTNKPTNAKVYFQYRNRETLQTEKKYLGKLSQMQHLTQKFDAPEMPDIYYNYQLIFENMTGEEAGHIAIEHTFEFNALTFPLHRKSDKIVCTDSIDEKHLLFEIRQ